MIDLDLARRRLLPALALVAAAFALPLHAQAQEPKRGGTLVIGSTVGVEGLAV